MPSLGVVLGSILGELTQARRIADALTAELLDEYQADPRLAALSVPRAVLGDVTISLRFQVNEVQAAPVLAISPTRLESLWETAFRDRVLPRLLRGLGLSPEEEAEVVVAITTEQPAREIRRLVREPAAPAPPLPNLRDLILTFDPSALTAAAGGDRIPLVRASVTPITDSWTQIPADVRRKIGTKAAFTEQLTGATDAELAAVLNQENARAEIAAALRSRIDVLVRGEDIEDPNRIQSLTVTLRGADVEAVLTDSAPGTEQ